jgi:RNA polymerase sigma factor (sigma-70 family)
MIHFDESRHCSMTTFVYAYVDQYIRNQKRDDLKYKSIETDNLLVEQSYTEDLDLRMLVEELLDNLNEVERKVIVQKWFENKTLVEIAENIGMSKAWVGQINKRAMNKMREMLPEHSSEVFA